MKDFLCSFIKNLLKRKHLKQKGFIVTKASFGHNTVGQRWIMILINMIWFTPEEICKY